MKRRIVLSAVNFTEGGPLTILREAVASCVETLSSEWEVWVLAHDASLIGGASGAHVLAFPYAKSSWLRRLKTEWMEFHNVSRRLQADIWVSLHDITPRVVARRQAVYCHNPAPFYRLRIRDALLDPRFALFNLFYKYLYRCFLNRNSYVIVQQDWLRREFRKLANGPETIVAHPSLSSRSNAPSTQACDRKFVYPALPRVFKNVEVIGEACRKLVAEGVHDFEVRVTIAGDENAYARSLRRRFSDVSVLRFVGRQTPQQMQRHYEECATLIFPSLLETWGLPITEAKAFGRRLVVADLPYARETVGTYDDVCFFDPENAEHLARNIRIILTNTWKPTQATMQPPCAPYASDWEELWTVLTRDFGKAS